MTVPNMRGPLNEKLQYITADGVVHNLHNPPDRVVIHQQGWGKPEQSISTTTAPYQHGATPISYRFQPRSISVLMRHNEFTRQGYWTLRSNLLDTLGIQRTDPNKPETGTLRRIYLENGQVVRRDLKVFLDEGLIYNEPNGDWDHFSVQEELRFIAHDPLIYDPALHTVTLEEGQQIITYTGSFEAYPIFTVQGPVTNLQIRNLSTGGRVSLTGASGYSIAAEATVVIDTTPGQRSILLNGYTSLIGYLSSDSFFPGMCLRPHPRLTSGLNNISVAFSAGSPTITMTYYNTYLGI